VVLSIKYKFEYITYPSETLVAVSSAVGSTASPAVQELLLKQQFGCINYKFILVWSHQESFLYVHHAA